MESFTTEIAQLLAAGLAALVSWIMGWFRHFSARLDTAKPFVRTIVVGLLALAGTALGDLAGLPVEGNPLVWDAEAINGVVVWLASMGLHAGKTALQDS